MYEIEISRSQSAETATLNFDWWGGAIQHSSRRRSINRPAAARAGMHVSDDDFLSSPGRHSTAAAPSITTPPHAVVRACLTRAGVFMMPLRALRGDRCQEMAFLDVAEGKCVLK